MTDTSRRPVPGIEIKGWFPLSTEITGRFRESESNLADNNIKFAVVCWLPEHIIFGQPKVIGVWVDDALEVARSRDRHYHKPPGYLVLEPEDTTARTRNLQQTNCNGYKFQGTDEQLLAAEELIDSWGSTGRMYLSDRDSQRRTRTLFEQFNYRLDTNFAKIDRIQHASLETFKSEMLSVEIHGRSIKAWFRLLAKGDRDTYQQILNLA